MEEMTEGQSADYMAGIRGGAMCRICGYEFDLG